ncbi:MAG: hypothetical protein K9H06_20510 [Melioribacteraceae bacterium]|nr:hypothetical protein [Melioribacteraceae bacterium]
MRLAEILRNYLSEDCYYITHQMKMSRVSNIIGNIMYYCGQWEWMKNKLHQTIIKNSKGKVFISTDPLISMIIPRKCIIDNDTHIIHIVRNKEEFAESFFRISRNRFMSFIAHNLVPFWQLGIWPLENVFNRNINLKYKRLWENKNKWFRKMYQENSHYENILMKDLFKKDEFNSLLRRHLDVDVFVSAGDLKVKSNNTK